MIAKYSILIIDDHVMVREGLSMFVTRFNLAKQVYQAKDGREGLDLLDQQQIDLVLCDVKMPVMDGYETVREIVQRHPLTRIIMLSAYDNAIVLAAFLKLGVQGYLVKTDPSIDTAIQSVMAGEIYISESLRLAFQFSTDYVPELTPRETDLLELLAKGFTTPQMSSKLGITSSTIETYRKDILKKFRVHNTVELVDLMHRIGKL